MADADRPDPDLARSDPPSPMGDRSRPVAFVLGVLAVLLFLAVVVWLIA